MDVRVRLETTFADRAVRVRKAGQICRLPDHRGPETLGLHLYEGKKPLTRLQDAFIHDQVDDVLKARRACDTCGMRRSIHDDRGRITDTLYGRFRVRSPRLRQCACELPASVSYAVLPSPVVELFAERATPEFQRLQAELGS